MVELGRHPAILVRWPSSSSVFPTVRTSLICGSSWRQTAGGCTDSPCLANSCCATGSIPDVLALAKRDLRPATLSARRQALREIVAESERVRVVSQYEDGKQLFKSVTAHGLEGVVAKRLDSPYIAGRSDAWLKVRASTARSQERR